MLTLGIESSCDETAAAILDSDGRLLSNVVCHQDELHAEFGGVVPELASREHLVRIREVVERALSQADGSLSQLEGIAVTRGPGLIGSLLVGISFARALAYVRGIPIRGVNHLEGHMMAPFVGEIEAPFPFVALLVSGGHTSLYHARALGQYERLGGTRDDAAGEAFDKVAKLLGLGYPGGARIDALSQQGEPTTYPLPRGMRHRGGYDFSFSGLKTAVSNLLRSGPTRREDVAASFQAAVVDILVEKTLKAVKETGVGRVVVSGGVSANSALRSSFQRSCDAAGLSLHIPPLELCTDNGAMIAWVGRQYLMRGLSDSLTMTTDPRLVLG